jgi:membrane-bound lytic murein transglycosylase A
MGRLRNGLASGLIVVTASLSGPVAAQALAAGATPLSLPQELAPLPADRLQPKTRWVAVRWAELPGFEADALHEAWNAWLKSCERPGPVFLPLCSEVRRLSLGDGQAQRAWLMARLQPYRIESRSGEVEGLLTGYYEPQLEASRRPDATFKVPLYQPPLNQAQRRPWYTRQQIDSLPEVQAQLAGREIAYLANPVDALVLQIQGSGRLRIRQPDGSLRSVRLAYAGSNEQPYKSVGRWLLDQGALRDASWPSIKNWVEQNPERVNEMLWSNPRTVFFREEPLSEQDAVWGPRGSQGVPLTPGRSIAVDPLSIPFGTPVWLASAGPTATLRKLVLAQDAGSAITGAVRADYFAGWGPEAQELAGRMKQTVRLWALWPK